jgi:hypothetical protein
VDETANDAINQGFMRSNLLGDHAALLNAQT